MRPNQSFGQLLRYLSNLHLAGRKRPIFLLSTPRSGSTWLMEAIASDTGVRPCNEPLNIRKPEVRKRMGVHEWEHLVRSDSLPKVERYLRNLLQGGIGYVFRTPRPFQKNYHFLTDRVVFKVLFGLEDRIEWLKRTFDAQVVCLVRHPIPVSISREELPRLPSLAGSDYVRTLSPTQQSTINQVCNNGTPLVQAQLDWCLQNKPLIDQFELIDLFVTYEQMVLQPDLVVDRLIELLALADRERVRASVNELSGSVSKSSEASRALLMQRQSNSLSLLAKWRKTVNGACEQKLMEIVRLLGVDLYRTGSLLPAEKYWIGDDYPAEPDPVKTQAESPA